MAEQDETLAGLPPTRIEALADGIFAVAMTLLVLELHVPDLARDVVSANALDVALFALWPSSARREPTRPIYHSCTSHARDDGMVGYGVGLAFAFIEPRVSLVFYAVMPLFYVLPGRIDRHLGSDT